MGLIEELLGTSILNIDRSYWAVKLRNNEWVSEARIHVDPYTGIMRNFDWSADLVANDDVLRIQELWLICPPGRTSPLGNTARLDITEPGTAFQFKVGMVDSNVAVAHKTLQAHIIGKVVDKITGACECFIYDPLQAGLITPDTLIYDKRTGGLVRDEQGNIARAGRTSVYDFHSWNPGSIAPLGRLEFNTIGVRL